MECFSIERVVGFKSLDLISGGGLRPGFDRDDFCGVWGWGVNIYFFHNLYENQFPCGESLYFSKNIPIDYIKYPNLRKPIWVIRHLLVLLLLFALPYLLFGFAQFLHTLLFLYFVRTNRLTLLHAPCLYQQRNRLRFLLLYHLFLPLSAIFNYFKDILF